MFGKGPFFAVEKSSFFSSQTPQKARTQNKKHNSKAETLEPLATLKRNTSSEGIKNNSCFFSKTITLHPAGY